MAGNRLVRALAVAGAITLSVTGCDNVEQQAEIQGNVAAFVDACNGNLSSELTVNPPSSSSPLSVKLTCSDADKGHPYFKELTKEHIQALKDGT